MKEKTTPILNEEGEAKMKPVRKLFVVALWFFFIFIFLGCSQKEVIKDSTGEQVTGDGTRYVIGPEDVLDIQVWREQGLSGKVSVRLDGKISLPLLQDVQAAGLTPIELQRSLIEKLKELVDSPNVSVIVVEANSFKIFVVGQVKSPGQYRLRTETTLVQAIPLAGGFTDWANQKKILIVRKDKGEEMRITANYKKMIDGRVPPLILKSGDYIIVP